MKTTTIRELKHAITRVLGRAEQVDTVEVTRRCKPVVNNKPLAPARAGLRPDFGARLHALHGEN